MPEADAAQRMRARLAERRAAHLQRARVYRLLVHRRGRGRDAGRARAARPAGPRVRRDPDRAGDASHWSSPGPSACSTGRSSTADLAQSKARKTTTAQRVLALLRRGRPGGRGAVRRGRVGHPAPAGLAPTISRRRAGARPAAPTDLRRIAPGHDGRAPRGRPSGANLDPARNGYVVVLAVSLADAVEPVEGEVVDVYSNSSSAPKSGVEHLLAQVLAQRERECSADHREQQELAQPTAPLLLCFGASRRATEASRNDSAADLMSFCSFLSSKICFAGDLPFDSGRRRRGRIHRPATGSGAAPRHRRCAARTGSASRRPLRRRPSPPSSSLPCHPSSFRLRLRREHTRVTPLGEPGVDGEDGAPADDRPLRPGVARARGQPDERTSSSMTMP